MIFTFSLQPSPPFFLNPRHGFVSPMLSLFLYHLEYFDFLFILIQGLIQPKTDFKPVSCSQEDLEFLISQSPLFKCYYHSCAPHGRFCEILETKPGLWVCYQLLYQRRHIPKPLEWFYPCYLVCEHLNILSFPSQMRVP